MIEKRLFERINLNIESKIVTDESKAYVVKILDLCENGLTLYSESLLNIDRNKDILINIYIDGELYNIFGKLKWEKKYRDGNRYGFIIKPNKGSLFSEKIKRLAEQRNKGYFLFEVTVYLKDVNVFGTGYFSRYFDWQGMAREEYFVSVPNYQEIILAGIKLITKKAWIEYFNHCTPFQKLLIKIQNKNIKRYSFEMIFTYIDINTSQLIAIGGQVLVFADSSGKLIKIPNKILEVIQKHQTV